MIEKEEFREALNQLKEIAPNCFKFWVNQNRFDIIACALMADYLSTFSYEEILEAFNKYISINIENSSGMTTIKKSFWIENAYLDKGEITPYRFRPFSPGIHIIIFTDKSSAQKFVNDHADLGASIEKEYNNGTFKAIIGDYPLRSGEILKNFVIILPNLSIF